MNSGPNISQSVFIDNISSAITAMTPFNVPIFFQFSTTSIKANEHANVNSTLPSGRVKVPDSKNENGICAITAKVRSLEKYFFLLDV